MNIAIHVKKKNYRRIESSVTSSEKTRVYVHAYLYVRVKGKAVPLHSWVA